MDGNIAWNIEELVFFPCIIKTSGCLFCNYFFFMFYMVSFLPSEGNHILLLLIIECCTEARFFFVFFKNYYWLFFKQTKISPITFHYRPQFILYTQNAKASSKLTKDIKYGGTNLVQRKKQKQMTVDF